MRFCVGWWWCRQLNSLAGVEGPCLGTRRNEKGKIGASGEGMKGES